MASPSLALLLDYPEEDWPSMELCAEMLFQELQAGHAHEFRVARFCPPFRRRLTHMPLLGRTSLGVNADRLLNRLWYYPRAVRPLREAFTFFHLCDHSYAQLVRGLPAERTGVFCHDLDTFRCLLEPHKEPRPRWFRAMARRILHGLQQAAVVFHTTQTVREEILSHQLVEANRLVQAPLGVAPEFSPVETEPVSTTKILAPLGGAPFLLHVGSCIPRKRVDVLLKVFAAVRSQHPRLHLVKAGGEWTEEQRKLIAQLRIDSALHHPRRLTRSELAGLYRNARLVLVPSEREGFGIPIVEALACGAVVVAGDHPSLREAGGGAVVYVPVGVVSAWIDMVQSLLGNAQTAPTLAQRLAQAQKFSWRTHAAIIARTYLNLAHRQASSADLDWPQAPLQDSHRCESPI